jgi:serine/threonine-protein kinase
MEQDGYVDGEERFILEAIPGQRGLFSVKDKIRPALPSDLSYDLSRSRSSCQEVRTEVNNQPLRARFDGSRLTVEVAKIAPLRSMFLREGTKVHGCIKLRDAKASIVQSALERY